MSRALRWALLAGAAILVLVIAALAAVPYLVDLPRVRTLIASSASQALGRTVKFQSLAVTALPLPAVELHGVEVAEDPQFGTEPFLRLDTGRVRLKLRPLLSGRLEFGTVTLRKPVISVVQRADGRLNLSTLGPAADTRTSSRSGPRAPGSGAGGGAGGALLGSTVSIDDGVVVYATRRPGAAAAARYRMEDVDLGLTGRGSQVGFKGTLRIMPGDVAVTLADGIVAIGGARTPTDAPLRGAVRLEGKEIGPLAAALLGPAPAIAGALAGTLTLGGTLGSPALSGPVEISRPSVTQVHASCPEPKRRTLALGDLQIASSYRDRLFTGQPVRTSIGGAPITAQLHATLGREVRVQLTDISVKGLRAEKVLVDYLCQGYAISGPLEFTGAASFLAGDPLNTLSGPGTVKVGAGKVVGPQALGLVSGVLRLGGTLSSVLSGDVASLGDAPLEFDSITATYQASNGIVTTRDLLYTSRAMKVAIAGTYALATGRMNLDMVVSHSRGDVRAKVTGTAAAPSIRVAPSSVIGDPTAIERGLDELLRRLR